MRRLLHTTCGLLVTGAIIAPVSTNGQVTIDDFQTGQSITNAGPGVVGPSAGIVGSHRTGRVKPDASTSTMDIASGEAAFTSDGVGGNVVLEWDGDTDTAGYNGTGLGGVDLTVDSGSMPQVGIKFEVLSAGPYSINVVVSTDDDHASALPAAGTGPETVTLLFADFADAGSLGPADFANVGALLMNFAGTSNITIGAVTTCPDPGLPVELASFDALASGSVVDLTWTVSSQTDNAGFDVEHRVGHEASAWSAIGFVASTGDSNSDVTYAFRTDVGIAGRHQFRLRMVDLDGTFTYSPTTEVSVDVPGSFVLGKAYPNPFNPSTTFTLALARDQHVAISVFDLLGRKVKELHQGVLQGSQTHQFRLDASDLTTGIYMIKAAGEFDTTSEMVTLVK